MNQNREELVQRESLQIDVQNMMSDKRKKQVKLSSQGESSDEYGSQNVGGSRND